MPQLLVIDAQEEFDVEEEEIFEVGYDGSAEMEDEEIEYQLRMDDERRIDL